jgi:hypothetical protein
MLERDSTEAVDLAPGSGGLACAASDQRGIARPQPTVFR